jgi:predicted TIM-barrel fold metal-dependent hydrolase
MDRYLVISADCHAGPLVDQAREYVSPKYREAYDEWASNEDTRAQRKREHTGTLIYSEEALDEFSGETGQEKNSVDGAWESNARLNDINADGVVAEVIFPGGGFDTITPFDVGLMTYQYPQSADVWLEGCRAYNRWLADFCAQAPLQRKGVGLITVDDIDVTVQEVRQMHANGIDGGIILPTNTNGLPYYNSKRYDPLWAVCEELDMPVHTHTGWSPNYGDNPGSLGVFLFEIEWFAHRPFHFMIWGGVFERYPKLKFVMAEQGVSWLPNALKRMDGHYELPMFNQLRKMLPRKPSEYFATNAYLCTAAFMEDNELELRHEIGTDRLMWGSDYPHIEGTWPDTAAALARTFKGVPEQDCIALLGGNAAGVYGFDLEKLRAIANDLGPLRSAVGA